MIRRGYLLLAFLHILVPYCLKARRIDKQKQVVVNIII